MVGATQPALAEKKPGMYICRVSDQQDHYVFSSWARIKVHPIKSGLPHAWQGSLVIGLQPESQTVRVGHRASLRCIAFGIPAPSYQWYRNGTPLPHHRKEEMLIPHTELRDQGTYLCAVTSDRGGEECWSCPADVSVVDSIPKAVPSPAVSVPDCGERWRGAQSPTSGGQAAAAHTPRFCATDKVALLIGNMNYTNHPRLLATMMDVFELSHLLQQLGFRVLSLLDLSKEELLGAVGHFLQLLDSGVYAVFYYAGHGYECSGRNYIVPINAPNPYKPENCINVQKVLWKMQEKKTALNVVLLDMCRKWYNQNYIPSEAQALAPTGNIVYGYATCEDAEAYEVQDGEHSSGIFMKYLKKHILKKEKVTQILENVSEDMGRDPLIVGKQVMEIRHSLKERRALTDQICSSGRTAQLTARNQCWSQANELPGRRTIVFPCGAEVQISCCAVFSNVMVVNASVKTPGPWAASAKVSFRKPADLEDIFSDLEGGSDSLLSSAVSEHQSDTVLKLCGLHRLQRPLTVPVVLQYRAWPENLRKEEMVEVDLGRPLVAKLELYKMLHGTRIEGASPSPTPSPYSSPCPSPTPGVPKSRSRAWGPGRGQTPSPWEAEASLSTGATSNNQPEENDESETHSEVTR
eukprot:gi/632979058/ref/XP_007906259.1/ PREDICTED: mucosa-associated lymphoid tissue lymphoma translocation protein 1-like [Callorhinchus milii]